MSFKKNQTGFTAVEITLVIVFVVLIGAVGYLVWHNQHKPAATSKSTSTTSTQKTTQAKTSTMPANQYAGWKTVSFTQEGLTLKYPSDWMVVTQYVAGDTALNLGQNANHTGLGISLTYATSGVESGSGGNYGYTPVATFTFNNQPAYIVDDKQNDGYWLSSCAAPSLCFFSAKSNTSDGIELNLGNGIGQDGTTLPSSSTALSEAVKIMESLSY